ncbi:adhesion G protein-coupled receptor L4-like [Lycorma delicatula]|uniref:adhesion G protein-coupled receptor L4-like n=1 Tax=Lycorma delicatula TaxID=130591 RepID=UPI003F51943A
MENVYSGRVHGFPNWTVVGVASGEEGILSLIVVLGSSLSLVGLVFAFITYSLFSDLRSLSGTILMNLLAALFMSQLMYVIGVGGIQDAELCLSLSFSLHYFHLTVYCWLLSMTHDLYRSFRRNVNVDPVGDKSLGIGFLIYSLLSWGGPLLLLIAAFCHHYYYKNGNILQVDSLKHFNCWFLDKEVQLLTYFVPVVNILVLQLLNLGRAAVLARYTAALQVEPKCREKMQRRRQLHIMLYVKIISIVMGVCFSGIVTSYTRWNIAWILFNVGHSLQGITIALIVTCNCQVVSLYTRSLKRKHKARNGISRSASLQLLTWSPTPDAV